MVFKLNQRLQEDSIFAVTQQNIQIRLVNDSQYFWIILVPTITETDAGKNVHEIHDLPAVIAANLWSLTSHLSKNLKSDTNADKINIAAIGNVVSQLHLHIVARHRSDPQWPAPVWGRSTPVPLSPEVCEKRLASIQNWQRKFSGTT